MPPHTHAAHTDLFYVLEGELELRLGDGTVRVPAGTCVAALPLLVHGFRNPGDVEARFLNLHAPGVWARGQEHGLPRERARPVRPRARIAGAAADRERARRRRPADEAAPARAREGAVARRGRARVLRRRRVRRRGRPRASAPRGLLPRARGRARVPRRTARRSARRRAPRSSSRRASCMRSRASAARDSSTCTRPRAASPSTCAASTRAKRSTQPRTTATPSIDAGARPGRRLGRGRGMRLPSLLSRGQGGSMARKDAFTRRAFLKKSGAAGVAVAGGTLVGDRTGSRAGAQVRQAARAAPAHRHLVPGEPLVRPLLRLRAAGSGRAASARRRGYTQPDAAGVGHAPYELTALRDRRSAALVGRRPRPVERRQDGRLLPSTQEFFGDGNISIAVLHGEGAAVLLQPLRQARGSARTTSARVLGPTWPNRFYLMSGTSGGITTNGHWGYGIFDSGSGRSSSTSSTTRRSLEDLLHRLRRRRGRRHRQRRGLLEPVRARPAHDGDARRLPRGLPQRDAPERLVDHPELLDAVRRAPGRRRVASGWASSSR